MKSPPAMPDLSGGVTARRRSIALVFPQFRRTSQVSVLVRGTCRARMWEPPYVVDGKREVR